MSRRALVTTVVFDLDDTLYDCHRQRVLAAHRHACRALLRRGLERHAGRRLTIRRLMALRLRLFYQDRALLTLDPRVCKVLGLRGRALARIAAAGRRAYFSYPVRRLHLFQDTRPVLRRLHRAGVRVYVITAGLRRIQRAKVRVLGLARMKEIRGISFTGLLRGRGKTKYLRRVLGAESYPRRVLVVGDRPDSEIRAARQLRMRTVRRLGGEFAHFAPANHLERADFTIRRLSQLFRLPLRFGARR